MLKNWPEPQKTAEKWDYVVDVNSLSCREAGDDREEVVQILIEKQNSLTLSPLGGKENFRQVHNLKKSSTCIHSSDSRSARLEIVFMAVFIAPY